MTRVRHGARIPRTPALRTVLVRDLGARDRIRITTWNVNSLRRRAGCLPGLVALLRPDVLCLQETKVPDELFPVELPAAVGLPYFVHRGMKAYNGVAILSRIPFSPLSGTPEWCGKHDCRHLAIALDVQGGPVILHDFYVPAGGAVPDARVNAKFAHKLAFLEEVRAYFAARPLVRTIVAGDFNIAPCENDVWDHRRLLDVVSHTAVETDALEAWRAIGFTDAIRHFVPREEKVFTWWSYRNRAWRISDRGRRLDHVWVSHDLTAALREETILREARGWMAASDHVPVSVELLL